MESLDHRRADLVNPQLIDGYVTLNWLEWNGGTLRLTETGQNMRNQLRAERK